MTVKAHEASAGEALPLSPEQLNLINAWWRAANYLSVGQIYLLDNPLLREPLKIEHVKPRLLGHWGTAPGLNFIHVHLNRINPEIAALAPKGRRMSANPHANGGALMRPFALARL
jgi:xylulose-5-phosphate/fructose-6-phosphate phosphoketolase